jgi:hypothetical protein
LVELKIEIRLIVLHADREDNFKALYILILKISFDKD